MKKIEVLNICFYVKPERLHTVPVKLKQTFSSASKTVLKERYELRKKPQASTQSISFTTANADKESKLYILCLLDFGFSENSFTLRPKA